MSKEAMKLALEAMRGVIAWHIMRNHMVPYRVRDPLQEAITAISEALAEQPAQQEPDAIVTSLVAGPDGVILAGLDRELPLMTGVYLAPQPAKRKPLTDKEIDSFRETNSEGRGAGWRFNFKGFARAIEAAHGIKENT